MSHRPTRLAVLVTTLALAAAAVPVVTGGAADASPIPTQRPTQQPTDTAGTPRAAASLVGAFTSAHELRGDFGPAAGTPRTWAARAFATQAHRLGVDAASYRWELVRHTLIGTSVRGRQYRGGVPIVGTDVLVASIGGRVAQIDAHGTALRGAPSARPVGVVTATAVAKARLDVTSLYLAPHVDRVLEPVAGRLVDTYQVSLVGKAPARAALVHVDAATGVVRSVSDPSAHARAPHPAAKARTTSVKAKVFDPNPVVTSRNTGLRSPFETGTGVDVPLDSAALTRQLRTRTMHDLDPTQLAAGNLTGTYVNVQGSAGYLSPGGGALQFSRSLPQFVGLMTYEHIDRYQRWLHAIGFRNVNSESQDTIPTLAEGYDNSMYMPGEDVIVYGGGGVPDAEDAEVVLHEYGHAIQDAQVPGYGATEQGGAMGEGFGDFNGANYYSLTSGGFGNLCDAEWDSTSYSTTNPPCLRRLDSTKRFPKDVQDEVHADGEMWSAFLWRLRSHLGHTTAQKVRHSITLVLSMHELLTPNATYGNAVAGLRTAAKALHHPGWVKFVTEEAKRTGYPLNP